MEFGAIWVQVADGVTPSVEDKVYLVVGGADSGKMTNVSTDNLDTGFVVDDYDSETNLVSVKNTNPASGV